MMIDIKNNGDSNITKPLSFSQNQSYKNNIDDEETQFGC